MLPIPGLKSSKGSYKVNDGGSDSRGAIGGGKASPRLTKFTPLPSAGSAAASVSSAAASFSFLLSPGDEIKTYFLTEGSANQHRKSMSKELVRGRQVSSASYLGSPSSRRRLQTPEGTAGKNYPLTVLEDNKGVIKGIQNTDGTLTTAEGTTEGRGGGSGPAQQYTLYLPENRHTEVVKTLVALLDAGVSLSIRDIFGGGFDHRQYARDPGNGRDAQLSIMTNSNGIITGARGHADGYEQCAGTLQPQVPSRPSGAGGGASTGATGGGGSAGATGGGASASGTSSLVAARRTFFRQ